MVWKQQLVQPLLKDSDISDLIFIEVTKERDTSKPAAEYSDSKCKTIAFASKYIGVFSQSLGTFWSNS